MTWGAPLTPAARIMWRAVRDAGVDGIKPDELRARVADLVAGVDEANLKNRLQYLKTAGYLSFKGQRRTGVWNLGTKVPKGELPTPGADPTDGIDLSVHEEPEAELEGPLSKAVQGVPKGVPNSVWALGQVAEPTQAPRSEPVDLGERPTWHLMQTDAAGNRSAVVSSTHPSRPEPLPALHGECAEPRFALDSHNRLSIDDGSVIVFEPHVTRALFRWLDRLGGTNLARITAEEGA